MAIHPVFCRYFHTAEAEAGAGTPHYFCQKETTSPRLRDVNLAAHPLFAGGGTALSGRPAVTWQRKTSRGPKQGAPNPGKTNQNQTYGRAQSPHLGGPHSRTNPSRLARPGLRLTAAQPSGTRSPEGRGGGAQANRWGASPARSTADSPEIGRRPANRETTFPRRRRGIGRRGIGRGRDQQWRDDSDGGAFPGCDRRRRAAVGSARPCPAMPGLETPR